MSQKQLIKQILNGTYQYDPKDNKFFTPDFIRRINTNWDIEFMLYTYVNNTPFKDVDINILREWKDHLGYMFFDFLTNYSEKRILEMKQQNPAVWKQFCTQFEQESIQFARSLQIKNKAGV